MYSVLLDQTFFSFSCVLNQPLILSKLTVSQSGRVRQELARMTKFKERPRHVKILFLTQAIKNMSLGRSDIRLIGLHLHVKIAKITNQ